MKLDKIDLAILHRLYTLKEKKTTTYLAKEIFKPQNRREYQNCDNKMRKRLDKMVGYGIVINEKIDEKKYYSLDMDKVICASGEIKANPKTKDIEKKTFHSDKITLFLGEGGMYVHAFIPVAPKEMQ